MATNALKPLYVATALLFMDALLSLLIIYFIPYTKIDWDAYMDQVAGFIGGERDYKKLKGDTGPLVYPAGFLYVYAAVKHLTGGEVYPAQFLFGVLYIINLLIVFFIYTRVKVLPSGAFCLLCLSKRIHSIFMLRLFNDCFAMTMLHLSLACLICQRWYLASVIFSGAVSIKMNVLLFAPALFLLLLKGLQMTGVIFALSLAAFVQMMLGLPFLLSYPISYLSGAFDLGRIFIHFWSVNFKFVPEEIFISKRFAVILLLVHIFLLLVFAHFKWCRHEGGLSNLLHQRILSGKHASMLWSSPFSPFSGTGILQAEHIATVMFSGNFIGIICARSLHYQFYSWYFYSLPFLLWKAPFPSFLRITVFATIECCWNIYPSNMYSSFLLFCAHVLILWGLWKARSEYPYMKSGHHAKADSKLC